MSMYLIMFLEFFKIGLFSVGGGLATLPFLFELTEKYTWFTAEELTNMIAVSESSPGPIGVNMATYVGFTSGGIWGAVLTSIALVMPSVIVILIISKILNKFRDNIWVERVFLGLRPAVVGILAVSVLLVYSQNFLTGLSGITNFLDYKKIIVYALLVFGIFKFKKHPIFYIAFGALAGVVFGM